MLNPIRRMKKALADLLTAEKQGAGDLALEQKKQAFMKAQKRVKRERSRRQLRDLGLLD